MQQLVLTFCGLMLIVAQPTLSCAQAPVVLSAPDAASVLELPLASSLTQNLTRHTTVKLASPAQHAQNGLDYPRWLSDASFSIKNRRKQRQTIVIAAKRGNPTLSTELLLEFDTDGQKTLTPYTFLLDNTSAFNGDPPPDLSTLKTDNSPDLRPQLKTPVIRFTPEEQKVSSYDSTFNGATDPAKRAASPRMMLHSRNKPSVPVTAPPSTVLVVPAPIASAPLLQPKPPMVASSPAPTAPPVTRPTAVALPAPTPSSLIPQSHAQPVQDLEPIRFTHGQLLTQTVQALGCFKLLTL